MTLTTTASAWSELEQPTVGVPARLRQPSRVLDFALGALIGLNGGLAIPGGATTAGELAAVVLVALALVRRSEKGWRQPPTAILLTAALALWFLASAALNGSFPMSRLGHMAVYSMVIVAIGAGRIDVPALVRGAVAGLVIGIAEGLLHWGSTGYAGRLSGILGDPNAAGYYLATIGTIFFALEPRRRLRRGVALILLAGVALTLSRTSLLALAVAVVWIVVPRRFRAWQKGAITLAAYVIGSRYAETLKTSGVFSDRAGSDRLRDLVYPLEDALVSTNPIAGHGPGTLTVNLQGSDWYFHSSYLLLRAEGGWVLWALMLALIAVAAYAATRPVSGVRNRVLESSLIVVLVCAINLGNVFLDYPAALAIGACLWWAGAPRTDEVPSPAVSDPQGAAAQGVDPWQ